MEELQVPRHFKPAWHQITKNLEICPVGIMKAHYDLTVNEFQKTLRSFAQSEKKNFSFFMYLFYLSLLILWYCNGFVSSLRSFDYLILSSVSCIDGSILQNVVNMMYMHRDWHHMTIPVDQTKCKTLVMDSALTQYMLVYVSQCEIVNNERIE